MDPDIFYFGFEHYPGLDRYFAAIGRALALAQRFESGCRVLAYIIFRRRNPEIILGGEDTLRQAIHTIYKQRLAQHIRAVVGITLGEEETLASLNAAREARNKIAHESALGYEHWHDELAKLPELLEYIGDLARDLAIGDRWVSLVASILTREPIPTSESLESYPLRMRTWVMGDRDA